MDIALFRHLEGGGEVEDLFAMLNGRDAAGGEALAVARAIHLVEDRHRRIARTDEVGVQRVADAGVDGAVGGDQRLRDHLAAEDTLHAVVWRLAAKKVHLDPFDVEQGDELGDGV